MSVVEQLGNYVLLACIVPSYLLVWYLSRVPWRKSPLGRGLMGLKFSLASILTLALFRVVFGADGLAFDVLRLVVYTLAFAALVTQARAFRQILIRAIVREANASEPSHRG